MDLVLSQPEPDKIQVLPHSQYHTTEHITPANIAQDPLHQFRVWFKDAVDGGKVVEPEAMSLSTATPDGIPSARIVLLKQVDARGFVFFTNYTSRKSAELIANPNAALVFYWREIHKSIRIVGTVEKVTADESDKYFQSRPFESRLGAWASKQSSVIGDDDLEARLQKVTHRFAPTGQVPTPDFWGGWRVIPKEIEFWCGKPSRLHERVRYIRLHDTSDGTLLWKIDKLAP